jgi:glycine cleavage system H protein
MTMEFPKDLRYTKDHEWAKKSDGGNVVIGISAFAVEQLGDITLVDLPEVGEEAKAGEPIGTIESVKAVSDLYAPVSGKVAKVNPALEDSPELLNESPYDEGWILEIAPSGKDFDALLTAKAYEELVAKEAK